MPMVPKRLTTAMAMATSSVSFLRDGDSAAIAEDPQIAVPNPTRIPVEPGQLNFLERKYVRINIEKMVNAIMRKLVAPIFAKFA